MDNPCKDMVLTTKWILTLKRTHPSGPVSFHLVLPVYVAGGKALTLCGGR